MRIDDLELGGFEDEVTGKVTDISPTKEIPRFGEPGQLAVATFEDGSGKISLTLWDDEVDEIKEGHRLTIKNGYVKEFRDVMQLSSGRDGEIIIHNEDEVDEED
jgi:replication factor A1